MCGLLAILLLIIIIIHSEGKILSGKTETQQPHQVPAAKIVQFVDQFRNKIKLVMNSQGNGRATKADNLSLCIIFIKQNNKHFPNSDWMWK